jgi:hypothetical protein
MEFFFRWIGDYRRSKGKQMVSLNAKLGRIILYRKTVEVIEQRTGIDPLQYIKLGVTDQYPNAFWIKPCSEDEDAAKKIHKMGGNTTMISAKSLFAELKAMGHHFKEKSDRRDAEWDEENKALKVDLTPKLESGA